MDLCRILCRICVVCVDVSVVLWLCWESMEQFYIVGCVDHQNFIHRNSWFWTSFPVITCEFYGFEYLFIKSMLVINFWKKSKKTLVQTRLYQDTYTHRVWLKFVVWWLTLFLFNIFWEKLETENIPYRWPRVSLCVVLLRVSRVLFVFLPQL